MAQVKTPSFVPPTLAFLSSACVTSGGKSFTKTLKTEFASTIGEEDVRCCCCCIRNVEGLDWKKSVLAFLAGDTYSELLLLLNLAL